MDLLSTGLNPSSYRDKRLKTSPKGNVNLSQFISSLNFICWTLFVEIVGLGKYIYYKTVQETRHANPVANRLPCTNSIPFKPPHFTQQKSVNQYLIVSCLDLS